MGLVGPDDRVHGWRYYYLGPKGFPLGKGGEFTFFWLFPTLLLVSLTLVFLVFRGYGLILALPVAWWSLKAARRVNRSLTSGRGLRHHLEVFWAEVNAPRPRQRVSLRRRGVR